MILGANNNTVPRGLGNSHLGNDSHHKELLMNSNPLSCGGVHVVDSQVTWIIGKFGTIAPGTCAGEGSWRARPTVQVHRYSGG